VRKGLYRTGNSDESCSRPLVAILLLGAVERGREGEKERGYEVFMINLQPNTQKDPHT